MPFFLLFMIVSCDRNEGTIYNGNIDQFTLLSTNGNAYRLEVIVDSTGILTIPFNASTLSSSDRTYSIELVEPEDSNEVVANPLTYDLPSSVTIPANQWSGDIVITGQDLGLVDTNPKPFKFRILDLNDKEFMDDNVVNVDVVEVCPFAEGVTFTGNYVVTTIVSGLPPGSVFADNSIVTLTATSDFTRTFKANYYPQWAGVNIDFSFDLVCEQIKVRDLDTGIYCSPLDPGETAETVEKVKINTGDVFGVYNPADDSEITLIYRETYGNCASQIRQVTFKLTKQ